MSQHWLEPKPGVGAVMIGSDRYLGLFMTAFGGDGPDGVLDGTACEPTTDLDAVMKLTAKYGVIPDGLREKLAAELREPGEYMNKHYDYREA